MEHELDRYDIAIREIHQQSGGTLTQEAYESLYRALSQVLVCPGDVNIMRMLELAEHFSQCQQPALFELTIGIVDTCLKAAVPVQ